VDAKTKFCLHSGLNTIGGNIAEIRYKGDRVLFDFGRAYNPADTLLTNAQGREGTKVNDMLRLGMIPAVDGLYDNSWPGVTAVFISHLHLDHMGAIDVIHPDVPVYMSRPGLELYNELQALGEGPFRQNVLAFDYEVPVHIGEISVTGYEIDHDVLGASAILVETPDMKIAHSGDIRMRGQRPELNHKWINTMHNLNLDYLLMEGTSFWPVRDADSSVDNKFVQHKEGDVPSVIAEMLQRSGVCFFNFYHRNIERMANLLAAANMAGRKLVFEPDTARLAAKFLPPTPGVQYYVLGESVTVEDINSSPQSYFVQNTLQNIFSLIDYNAADSGYIHTNGVPLGPFDPAFGSMVSFLQQLGIEFYSVPSAGHCDKDEILGIIDGIKPKVLVPWHSTSPDTMVPLDENQQMLMPEKGRWY